MRRARVASTSFLGAALALAWTACAAVPDIRFVDGEGNGDASSAEAGTDDDGGADAGVDAPTCSGAQPNGGTCCGTVWCAGQCDPATCADCEQKGCATGELCCGKRGQGQVLCKPTCP